MTKEETKKCEVCGKKLKETDLILCEKCKPYWHVTKKSNKLKKKKLGRDPRS